MLFVYPRPQRVGFWMKNTLIPLDMIFLDATGTVGVHHDGQPHDTTPIFGGIGRPAVLEINGGLAARYGISEGTEIAPGLRRRYAAWPWILRGVTRGRVSAPFSRVFKCRDGGLNTCMVRGVAQSGSAPVLGTGGREFESRRPDHSSIVISMAAAPRRCPCNATRPPGRRRSADARLPRDRRMP